MEILLTQTKTREERIVFFQETTKIVLEKMINIKTNHKYLLHNIDKDREPNYFDLIAIMKKIKKELSIEKIHPHMFRHPLATIWLQKGADIKSVMTVMGHKNLETTERYLHSKKEHVKKQYELFKIE